MALLAIIKQVVIRLALTITDYIIIIGLPHMLWNKEVGDTPALCKWRCCKERMSGASIWHLTPL